LEIKMNIKSEAMTNACCAEGADVEPPICVVLFGKSFAAIADEKMGNNISMTGPNSLTRLAEHLIALGHDPDRELSLCRAGQFIGKTSIGQAAKAFT
jgi:hypothetical protein